MKRKRSRISRLVLLPTIGAALAFAASCSSGPATAPPTRLQSGPLDRHEIKVVSRTEFLEIRIDSRASELSSQERARISAFVRGYAARGHGPLVLSLPQSSANPQLAVAAVAEARLIAWENGVEYNEMEGTAHGAGSAISEPMILAYQLYDAIPPDCPALYTIDFSDAASNDTLPSLGCSLRKNLAAMIVDPADLLGNRPADAADLMRREVILEKFRRGEMTASERTEQESGAVSTVVD